MKPTHILTDLGGVVLTNGWDRKLRLRLAEKFGIDPHELNDRHGLTYDAFESGKMDISLYLKRIIFYEPRSFTEQQVIDWTLAEGAALQETIDLVKELKARHKLKIGVISNESAEIAADRTKRFKLYEWVDFFVISGFVGLRKPDREIFQLAFDIAQIQPQEAAYLEDRGMYYEYAKELGLRAVWHRDAATTRAKLAEMGLD